MLAEVWNYPGSLSGLLTDVPLFKKNNNKNKKKQREHDEHYLLQVSELRIYLKKTNHKQANVVFNKGGIISGTYS